MGRLWPRNVDENIYAVWGRYYSTMHMIIDQRLGADTYKTNKKAFDDLATAGEIVKVSWSADQDTKVRNAISEHSMQEYRYGPSIMGGQWPAMIGGGFGYFHRLDAVVLRMILGPAQQDDGAETFGPADP